MVQQHLITPNSYDPWLGAHIYYAGKPEPFLTEAVKPFVQNVISRGTAEQFFFIRYWERGPHIRLRFKTANEPLQKKLAAQLTAHFEAYFHAVPSYRIEPDEKSSSRNWLPNNSIQYQRYEPEIERYGGPYAIHIAEKQFHFSSQTVLSLVEELKSYDRALGVAIQLHLIFSHAFGMDLAEASSFFTNIYHHWFDYASFGRQNTSSANFRQEETRALFLQAFNQQRNLLVSQHKQIWRALTKNLTFNDPWLNQWRERMRIICKNLEAAEEKCFYPPQSAAVPTRQKKWGILESYIHMTNNRLGIVNRDEAFLGYLISESLKHLTAEVSV